MYSKDSCLWCDRARDFLREKNISNVAVLKVGRDISPDDFRNIASTNGVKSTVPLIFYRARANQGWTLLGGYDNLVKYFETN